MLVETCIPGNQILVLPRDVHEPPPLCLRDAAVEAGTCYCIEFIPPLRFVDEGVHQAPENSQRGKVWFPASQDLVWRRLRTPLGCAIKDVNRLFRRGSPVALGHARVEEHGPNGRKDAPECRLGNAVHVWRSCDNGRFLRA